ncbi:hypothetical protein BC827DRAFT_1192440 [Russula dissimulans]|nr:hypothetical protein BC827DRAFT_1192440 [Russula dissimulans]
MECNRLIASCDRVEQHRKAELLAPHLGVASLWWWWLGFPGIGSTICPPRLFGGEIAQGITLPSFLRGTRVSARASGLGSCNLQVIMHHGQR